MTTPESDLNKNENEEIICYSKLARDGVTLLLNNKQNEAEMLFKSYPDSIQMNAGLAFAVVTDALMTFEDDKLQLALQTLKDLERKCSSNMSWMKSMKTRMFGTVDTSSYAEQLESQIILADCYVFVATLTFLQQDIASYFKGGWILRKSYKLYQQAYNEILNLYNEIVGDGHTPAQFVSPTVPPETTDIMVSPPQNAVLTSPSDASSFFTNGKPNAVPENTNAPDVPVALENTQATSLILEGPRNESITIANKPASSITSKNGYTISPCLHRTSYPKHSISCHENLRSLTATTTSNPKTIKNGFVKDDARARSAATQIRPFLRKSTSFNSALSESFERRSSLRSNISLSYLTSTLNIFMSKPNVKDIDKETIGRLLCAVSFGYGLLQLGISLLPPSMLKVTSFLGFGGNRRNGLENLMFARLGTDMRAPFATLTLLWYHTIVRPFYALDGNNVEAGVEAAARLIEESTHEYSQSALFLFFKGRVERLHGNIPEAIRAFQLAKENAGQRELRLMCLHEVGWCYLIQLDFSRSEITFASLRQASRWSRSFYSFLTLISAGSNKIFEQTVNVGESRAIFQPVPKGTQLDEFLNRRYKICPLEEEGLKNLNCLFWKLLVYELLYLWNTLPSCTNEHIEVMIGDCEEAKKINCEPMVGLADLIEGSSLCILKRFKEGMEKFSACLEKRKTLPMSLDGAHISAFAQYELGLLLIRNEQTLSEGKRLLQLVAYNYKEYDFEQRLSVRVHAIIKNL